MNKYNIFVINGGVGKNIIATSLLPHIDGNTIVLSAYPEVFLNNPRVHRVFRSDSITFFYDDYVKDNECKFLLRDPYNSPSFFNSDKHLSEMWAGEILDTQPSADSLNPQIFLTPKETYSIKNRLLISKDTRPILLFQPFGGPPNPNMPYNWTRDLSPVEAQKFVHKIKGYRIIQICNDNQIKLDNCEHFSAKNMRDIFALITIASQIVCIDSMVQHACVALNKQCHVFWIATPCKVFGYSKNNNIFPEEEMKFVHSPFDLLIRNSFNMPIDSQYPFSSMEIFGEKLLDLAVLINSLQGKA